MTASLALTSHLPFPFLLYTLPLLHLGPLVVQHGALLLLQLLQHLPLLPLEAGVKKSRKESRGKLGGLAPLEGAARYKGLLLAPAEGFGQGQGFFLPFGPKDSFFYYFGHFW